MHVVTPLGPLMPLPDLDATAPTAVTKALHSIRTSHKELDKNLDTHNSAIPLNQDSYFVKENFHHRARLQEKELAKTAVTKEKEK